MQYAPTMSESFKKLVEVMSQLRAPGGCPWDAEQTNESIIPYLIEESHEAKEALAQGDWDEFKEELGDVLCQVIFHSLIAEEAQRFNLSDVCDVLREKLVRRHPHVFAEVSVDGSDEVLNNWEKIKQQEKAEKAKKSGKHESILSGVPTSLPALLRSYRLGSKAARVGFEFPSLADAMAKVAEEFAELKEELQQAPEKREQQRLSEEFGDLLFSLVNVARQLKVNPEEALLSTSRKFQKRFTYIEEKLSQQNKGFEESSLEEMDALWDEAKKKNRS